MQPAAPGVARPLCRSLETASMTSANVTPMVMAVEQLETNFSVIVRPGVVQTLVLMGLVLRLQAGVHTLRLASFPGPVRKIGKGAW